MYTVDEVYKIVQDAVNKNQSGYVPPAQFNRIINQGSKSYQEYLLGQFKDYTPGRPIPRVSFGNNSTVRQRLSPTIYDYRLTVDSQGFSAYPGDYLQYDAVSDINGNFIRFVEQDSKQSYIDSTIDPVATNPIFLLKYNGFQFYPTTIALADLSYVKNVPDMVWGYVDDANGRPVYSEARSTQPVWTNASMLEVIVRALAIIGINLQLGVVMQYAENIKRGGQ